MNIGAGKFGDSLNYAQQVDAPGGYSRHPNPRLLVVRRLAPAAAANTTADPLAHQSVQSPLTPRGPREVAQDGMNDVEGAIHLRW